MLKRWFFIFCMGFSLQVTAGVISTELAPVPELLDAARAIVAGMTRDKPPEEILTMAEEIARVLSLNNLCGMEDIQAMMEAGIPFNEAYEAVIKACNIQGTELAALNRALAPGLSTIGGPGPDVSP